MKTGKMHSSCGKKCKVCGKKTGDYKIFEQSDMIIELPICDKHWKDIEEILLNIEFKADLFLREINKLFK